MTRRRTVIGAALVAVAVVAAGCAGKKDERSKLPFACETKKCICIEEAEFVLRKREQVPVEWKLTGDAYCPKGYKLRLAGG